MGLVFCFFQAEDGIRDRDVTGVETCALPISKRNFEVGIATIVDTNEAQARFDLTVSQEIAARKDRKSVV